MEFFSIIIKPTSKSQAMLSNLNSILSDQMESIKDKN